MAYGGLRRGVMRHHLLRTVVLVGLSIGLTVFFFRSADLGTVIAEIGRARLDFIGAAFIAISMSFVVRTRRWQLLLTPLASVAFVSAARSTAIGFAVTALLPGRLGEIVRPYLLARREKLSSSATLATVVVERFFDLFALVFFLGVFLLFFAGTLHEADSEVLTSLETGGLVAAAVAVVGLVIVVVSARVPESISAGLGIVEKRIWGRTGTWVSLAIGRFLSGFSAAGELGLLLKTLAWSVLVWGFVALSAWFTCLAFGISLPLSGSVLLTVLMALGVAVPTPGGVGGFHAVVQVGLTSLFAIQLDLAVGVALVLHAVAFGAVTIAGAIWMVRDGVSFSSAVGLVSSERRN